MNLKKKKQNKKKQTNKKHFHLDAFLSFASDLFPVNMVSNDCSEQNVAANLHSVVYETLINGYTLLLTRKK